MSYVPIDDQLINVIIQAHIGGQNVTQLQKTFNLGRRVIERILSKNLGNIRTKSDIIREQFPILGDRDVLIKMYVSDFLSLDDIAIKIGVSTQIIKNVFKELEIDLRPRAAKGSKLATLRQTPILGNKEWLIDQYVTNKRSVNSIADEFNISGTAVKTALDNFKITRRTFMEQIAATPSKGNELNSRLARTLRVRMYHALKGVGMKRGSAVKDLGIDLDGFKQYIESQFYPDEFGRNMTWDNYGANGWELDHIAPLSSFDLGDLAQFQSACHYTNIQPLWRSDNRAKSAAIFGIDTYPDINLIIVAGLSGSGKSWVCDQLNDDFVYISYDKIPKEQHFYAMVETAKQGKHILYDPLRKPISILKRYRQVFSVRLMVIDESADVIKKRIIGRGGSRTDNIDKFIHKIDQYKQYAEFSGTSSQVLEYIRMNKYAKPN